MTNPLLARFIPEARDLIQTTAFGLLKLEKNPGDDDAVNEVFRAVHTLKGSSGLFDVLALTRLVHAAEDLLVAIRADKLELDSSLVDMLLESLDQVSAWIEDLDRSESLPHDADRVSSKLAKELRARVETPGEAKSGSEAPAAAPGTERLDPEHLDPNWLAGFSEEQRLAAFRRIVAGDRVLALRYDPAEDCFFHGADPLGLVLSTPALLAIKAEPVTAFAHAEELDPYRCNLRFTLLATAPRQEVEHHLRYELEKVAISPVVGADLVTISGKLTDAPVWDDFRDEALRLLAEGDFAGVLARAVTLIDLMGHGLAAVAALRWLSAALEAAEPDRRVVMALIEAASNGVYVDPRGGGGEPEVLQAKPSIDTRAVESRAVAMAGAILSAQRKSLAGGAFGANRIASAARVLGNLAASLRRETLVAEINVALEAALAEGSPEPFLRHLDHLEHLLLAEAPANPSAAPANPSMPAAPASMPAAPVAAPAAAASNDPQSGEVRLTAKVLKVDQAKIDLLMNLIGELVVSKNGLPFLAKRAEEVHGSREMSREIKDQYAVIDRLAQEMQGAIMQVRMLPVSEVFDRFSRLVRDLARKLSKEIELVIEGEETAADKTIIEALNDPLLHIVRNSIDHGVESPARRAAAGKPGKATILLKASQEADSVVIEIRDDGQGIDPDKMRAGAVAKGVISQEQADRMSQQEAINLIFHPGFSTAKEVSDVSGRGVGMDVVRTTIEKLGGRVQVSSQVGVGTQTRLSLPLSMAVTRVMMVEAAGSLYGVPMDLIVETVRIAPDRIRTIKQAEAFVLRNALIPLVRMSDLLGYPAKPRAADDEEAVLVCCVEGRNIGLVIDNFREGMDVILKPLDGIVAAVPGYLGTALLGDGRVLLVLALKELL
jgi:two-component system chemotaxis sensor kinase CheA